MGAVGWGAGARAPGMVRSTCEGCQWCQPRTLEACLHTASLQQASSGFSTGQDQREHASSPSPRAVTQAEKQEDQMAVGTWQQSGPSRGSWCCFQARLPSLGVRHQGPPPPHHHGTWATERRQAVPLGCLSRASTWGLRLFGWSGCPWMYRASTSFLFFLVFDLSAFFCFVFLGNFLYLLFQSFFFFLFVFLLSYT